MRRLVPWLLLVALVPPLQAAQASFSLEGLYWRPIGADRPFAIDNTGHAVDLTMPYSPGYRARAEYDGWFATWLDLQSYASRSISCPNSDCSNVLGGFLADADALSATTGLRLQQLDLGARAELADAVAGKDVKVSGELGLRYVRFYERMQDAGHTTFVATIRGSRTIHSNTAGIGPRLGASVDGRLAPKLRLVCDAGASVLDGSAEYDHVFQGLSASDSRRLVFPELELAFKLVALPAPGFKAWLGYDFVDLIDVAPTNDIVSPVAYTTIQFTGPSAGASYSF